MPRPIPASTSTASTPPTSWRCWPARLRRAGRSRRRPCRGHPPRHARLDIDFAERARLPHQAAGHRARDRSTASSSACIPAWCRSARRSPHVEGVFNAVVAEGDFVGRTMLRGPRRRRRRRPPRRWSPTSSTWRAGGTCRPSACRRRLGRQPTSPMDRQSGAYYMRLMVVDRPGVHRAMSRPRSRDERVSLESMLQRGRAQPARRCRSC